MSGRLVFIRWHRLIKNACSLFGLFPKFVMDFVWLLLSSSNGKIALFVRYAYLKKYAKFIGNNVYIGSNCILKNIDKLSIGDNVSIHNFCYIDAVGEIDIGSHVSIAHNCSFVSFDHGFDDELKPIKYNSIKYGPIAIFEDVWIGCGARILCGTTIYSRSIIAAGAVVRGIVPERSIFGGVPARLIKKI